MDLRSVLGLGGPILRSTGPGLSSGIGALNASIRGDGPGSRDHCRTTFVLVEELLTILRGFALVLKLSGHGRRALTAQGCEFGWSWPYVQSASAPVIRDAIVVVNNNCAVIDIRDAGDIDAVDGAVVVEVISVPIAAVIAVTGVAESIVDTAVEADVQAPEAAMKAVAAAVEAPVTGGPERTVVGRGAPSSGNPVVAAGTPAPVAGGPEIIGLGSLRLLVDGERWWRRIGIFGGLVGFGQQVVVVLVALFGGVGLILSLRLILRLILGGRSGWGCSLGSILLSTLLVLALGADSQDPCGCGLRGGLLLAVVDRGQIGVGRIGTGVISDGGRVGGIVAAGDSDCASESCNPYGKA